MIHRLLKFTAAVALSAATVTAFAQKKYDVGATDTEIKIGQTMALSGPASAYATITKTQIAFFKMLNEQGGINGRKVNFVAADDAYSPPKTVEMTRRLIEQDQVLLLFGQLGTPTNTAVHKYVNAKKVPHLFLATGATKWNDPKNFPWTMGWQPNYQMETRAYAGYILKNHPNAKIGVLYQNDDYGKDYLKGLEDGLGDKAKSMIISKLTYEVSDPTIDSQILALKGAGADVFINITTPKFSAMAIRKVAEIGWKPVHFMNSTTASVAATLVPAGLDNAVGIITSLYLKDPTDPEWDKDPAMNEWRAFMKKYYPEGNLTDSLNAYAYTVAQNLVMVLKACGDNLTRENVMKQAASMKDLQLPLALPGVMINTSPDDFAPFASLQMVKFDGKKWAPFGPVVNAK